MSWHMNEKVMIGVIVGLVLSVMGSMLNVWYVAQTLNTNPPLTDRVLALEIKMSEFGKTMESINETMKIGNNLMAKIHQEQSRRTPMVNFIEKEMGRHK